MEYNGLCTPSCLFETIRGLDETHLTPEEALAAHKARRKASADKNMPVLRPRPRADMEYDIFAIISG